MVGTPPAVLAARMLNSALYGVTASNTLTYSAAILGMS
jgi:hypothetical protein